MQLIETIALPNPGDRRSTAPQTISEPPQAIDPQPAVEAAVRTAATRQISLNLGGAANVAVQLRERAGKIEVAVRSGDSQLTKSLQSGLGDLITRLENQGFKTQAWVPASTRQAAPSSQESAANQQPGGHSNGGSGNQQRQAQDNSNQRRQPRPPARFEEAMAEEGMK